MTTPVGWLCWDGVELVNHSRTLTYLRNGLGGPEWHVYGRAGAEGGGGPGYEDEYDDVYDLDPAADSPFNLACYCPQIASAGTVFVDPETDDAPWFVASRPESAEFLGILLDDLDDRPPQTRQVRRWASGGASMGNKVPTERSAAFTGTLVASTPAGMEWGRRWLSDVVGGGMCDDDASEVRYLPGCPDDPAEETAYRRYARVGLIDAPTFRAVADTPECNVMEARWQIAAGVPYLMSVPDLIATRTLTSTKTWNFQIDTDEWNGDKAVIVRLTVAGNGTQSPRMTIKAYPMYEGMECPMDVHGAPADATNPCHDVDVDRLPNYAVLEIDSAEEEAIYYNPTTKQPEAAWPFLEFNGPWSWLTVPPCSSVCLSVASHGGGTAAVQVDVYEVAREL